jgi:hypothetical protein
VKSLAFRFEEDLMANTTRRNWQMPLAERELSVDQDQRYDQGTRVSWGGIWAGVLTALGTLLLLSTLGLAVGIAANAGAGAAGAAGIPGAANVTPGTVGTAAVIWSALSLLIAMFLGGLASTRLGQISDRGSGMFHGGLVWVIALGAILYLGMRGLELMGAGAAMGLGGAGAAGAGDAANQAANAAAAHPGATAGIGWSPFIISALSLLAALAGAASGLRHLFDDSGSGSSTRLYDDSRTRYDDNRTRYDDTNRSTTTTTTTTRDRDRY